MIAEQSSQTGPNVTSEAAALATLANPVVNSLPSPATRTKIRTLADLEKEPAPMEILKSLINSGSKVLIFGLPKTGKSFVAIDLTMTALCGPGNEICRQSFAGKFEPVRALRVIYVSNEGVQHLRYRLRAAMGIPGRESVNSENVLVCSDSFNLFTGDGVDEFVEQAKECGQIDLLVIDHLRSHSVGADENSAKDVAKVVETLNEIQARLDQPAVVLVHHSNRGGQYSGSTAILATVDVSLQVVKIDGGTKLRCDVAKDIPEFEPIDFALEPSSDARSCYVNWHPPRRKVSESEVTRALKQRRAELVAFLRNDCLGEENAKKMSEIAENMSFTLPVVRKYVEEAKLRNLEAPTPVNGFREIVKPCGGKSKKKALHVFWDLDFKDQGV